LPLETAPTGNFVTRDEFEQVIAQLKNMLIPAQPKQPENIAAQF
jgi:hypothetical protein